MKTKNLFLALTLMGSIAATAQDVTILHMKDGTTRRYTNGLKETTNISLYEFVPITTFEPAIQTGHENSYSVTWDVNRVWHIGNKWVIGLCWRDDFAVNFQARHGVCFGTKPGLTIDDCGQKEYANDVIIGNDNLSYHYIAVGPTMVSGTDYFKIYDDVSNRYIYIMIKMDEEQNHITTPLEAGHTYYYRTFAEAQVEEHGQTKTVVFYNEEHSFRVPYVMADFDYYPYERATEDAMAEFATYFPDDVTAPTWEDIWSLWQKWRNTDEGGAISLDITTSEFDDGTGYRLNHVPQEFYTWMTNREVVIDAVDGLYRIDMVANASYDSVYVAIADTIYNVDASWGVPGGKYIRFTPTMQLNPGITYRSNELIPGVRYRLQLNFAPETEIENTDSTTTYFLPTKVRVTVDGQRLLNNVDISATEVSTFTFDDISTTSMGLDLKMETRVSSSQIRNGQYNRIMRIAEARLVPIKDEE